MKVRAFFVSILILTALAILSGCNSLSNIVDENEQDITTTEKQEQFEDIETYEENKASYHQQSSDEITEALTEEEIERIDKEETYPEAPGQLETVYGEMSQLVDDATHIAEVEIMEQSIVYLDGFPQTHTIVQIVESYKGDIASDAKLTVIEEGGYGGKVMGGIPQLSSESGYILFLIEYKDNYYVCGAYQGRFIINSGYVFQQATEDVKMRAYAPVEINEFRQIIRSQVSESEKQDANRLA